MTAIITSDGSVPGTTRNFVKYTVRKIESLTGEEMSRVVSETTRAFDGDPTFEFIFNSFGDLAHLVEVNMRYYLKAGEVYGAFDENGAIQGISLWSGPGSAALTAKTVLANGMLGTFFGLLFKVGPGSFRRMLKVSDCTQKNHYAGEHWYLYWITAFRPGAGGALMDDAVEHLKGYAIYLENSNYERNNEFYLKHGFEPLPEISWKGCVLHPMLRKR